MNPEGKKNATAKSFEDLYFYQRARELTSAVYAATRQRPFSSDSGLCDQIRRACVSIMSNTAEGFERGGTPEFIQFLYIAKGSCGEARAQLQVALDQRYVDATMYAALYDQARRISGMIANFITHLNGSDYQGAKANAPQRRAIAERERRLAALRDAQAANMRKRSPDAE